MKWRRSDVSCSRGVSSSRISHRGSHTCRSRGLSASAGIRSRVSRGCSPQVCSRRLHKARGTAAAATTTGARPPTGPTTRCQSFPAATRVRRHHATHAEQQPWQCGVDGITFSSGAAAFTIGGEAFTLGDPATADYRRGGIRSKTTRCRPLLTISPFHAANTTYATTVSYRRPDT